MSSHAIVEIGKVLCIFYCVWTVLCVLGALVFIHSWEHVWEYCE